VPTTVTTLLNRGHSVQCTHPPHHSVVTGEQKVRACKWSSLTLTVVPVQPQTGAR